ncbi:hypothetical protein [Rheinheimera sp.]|uniref:hypothetical protein n=1 Tax=Rheinheimera sp. TaxID=1869214 RepID=UPI00307E5376
MTSIIKLGAMLVISIVLTGCAAEAKLGKADVSGFNAANATVQVEYSIPSDAELTAEEMTEQQQLRLTEIQDLLKLHGFKPVSEGNSNFKIKISEGPVEEITGEWAGALGANAVIFTLGVVPAIFSYRTRIHYELWAGPEQLHKIDTPAEWDEAIGLISVSSTLSGADAARSKARTEAHDSVLRLWIEQGSFE